MKMSLIQLFALAALAVAFADGVHANPPEWQTLFSGQYLTDWTFGPENSWVVEDGAITLRREFDGKEHNADYLWTKELYGDFLLELEFKVPEQANSGIFLRTADRQDPVYTGIEVQITNSYGRESLSRGGTAGAIYDCLAPAKNALKAPGEWNWLLVSCKGPKIEVKLNGEWVIQMDLDRWTQPRQNPDGTPNKFPRALKDFARQGYIGLQDHGRAVWYRNIRVARLD